MEEIKLDVHVRQEVGTRKVKGVRRESLVPGIVYGGKKQPTLIKMDRKAYERIRRTHHGEVVFHLNVMEGEKHLADFPALVMEEQHDPVDSHLVHIDFKRISLTEKIHVKVAVIAKGDPVGVKKDGGSLSHLIWELDIICLPTNIPEKIEVEVSQMKIGDNIYVRDLTLPEGVTTKVDLESIVLTVVPPMKEVEAAPVTEAPTEPEVLREKKPEEGEKPAEEVKEKKSEEPKK
jgi:large subunit ribosomal protein L25